MRFFAESLVVLSRDQREPGPELNIFDVNEP
jgi:hypothetical protein